eukprot:COSAG03_NODE_2195_length_3017_cov_1022.417409_3_plen_107_part_00
MKDRRRGEDLPFNDSKLLSIGGQNTSARVESLMGMAVTTTCRTSPLVEHGATPAGDTSTHSHTGHREEARRRGMVLQRLPIVDDAPEAGSQSRYNRRAPRDVVLCR